MEAHFRAAQRALRDGSPDLAVKGCKTVLQLEPTLVEARINLGLAYHMLGQYHLAASELSQALRAQPRVLGANIVLGIDFLKLGRPEDAVAPLKQALAIEPSNHEARHNLASAYLAGKDYLPAGREFRELFLVETDRQEAWFGLGHDYLGISSQLTERVATEFGHKAWQPRLPETFWNNATSGMMPPASTEERSVQFNPGLPEARAALGKAYFRTGQAALAVTELERAKALDHYGDLHYLLYEAYRKMGKKDLAQAALAQSQKLRPESAAEDQAKIKRAENE